LISDGTREVLANQSRFTVSAHLLVAEGLEAWSEAKRRMKTNQKNKNEKARQQEGRPAALQKYSRERFIIEVLNSSCLFFSLSTFVSTGVETVEVVGAETWPFFLG
jgi:hypothetical protein